ncbi:hypothetical protein [Chitinolyticbacter albus]|uniref:hypothetical protein n=1 Tax=Chitinolyticbacter albus TaxID=2961951 RepID=UPI002108F235|nr:hypothetical protein [Chitinolyticbacter albus]
MEWLSEKISKALLWLLSLVKAVFATIFDILSDVFYWLVDKLFNLIVELWKLIPPIDFNGYSLQALMALLPDWLAYLFYITGFHIALAIIGGGVVFRLVRKLFTVGQW